MANTVLATFAILKDHVKLKVQEDWVSIDNIVFRLHYRATFLILIGSSILVTSRQFIGEHIKCIADTSLPEAMINTYCFFTTTYTVVKHMNATMVEQGEIPHPGVGPASAKDPVVHHAYYQWVPFVLFFQALLFYVPHFLWKKWEGGRLKALVTGLHAASLALRDEPMKTETMTVPSRKDRENKIKQIHNAFLERLHLNRPWSYYMGFCEVLNFLNLLLQMYLTDWFLGGAFIGLGPALTEPDSPGKMDPLDIVFPKVTKCLFHKYGPTGTIQKHDALCVMALNIVNEKIYTFLWFWFVVLAVITGLGLLWRLLTMLLHARSLTFNKWVFKMACPGKHNPWAVLSVTKEYHFGDWLFLYYIAKNLDDILFTELMLSLAQNLDKHKSQPWLARVPEEQELTKVDLEKLE